MKAGPTREPELLKATALAPTDWGAFEWDAGHNADLLTVSNGGRTIEWGPRKPQYTASTTRQHGFLHPPALVCTADNSDGTSQSTSWLVPSSASGLCCFGTSGRTGDSTATSAPAPVRGPTTHRPGTWCTTPSQSKAGSRSPQMVTPSWFPFAWSCRATPLAPLGFQCRGRSPGRSRCRRVPSSCRRPASCGSHRGCHSRAFARSSAPEAQPRVAPYRAAILVLRKRAPKGELSRHEVAATDVLCRIERLGDTCLITPEPPKCPAPAPGGLSANWRGASAKVCL